MWGSSPQEGGDRRIQVGVVLGQRLGRVGRATLQALGAARSRRAVVLRGGSGGGGGGRGSGVASTSSGRRCRLAAGGAGQGTHARVVVVHVHGGHVRMCEANACERAKERESGRGGGNGGRKGGRGGGTLRQRRTPNKKTAFLTWQLPSKRRATLGTTWQSVTLTARVEARRGEERRGEARQKGPPIAARAGVSDASHSRVDRL